MEKRKVLAKLLEACSEQLKVLHNSALAAHDAATHPDAKPENKYDTRGLEASYLAGAQAKRAVEIQRLITNFRNLTLKVFGPEDPIELTALVELEDGEGKKNHLFLVEEGGGVEVRLEKYTVRTITPESPMGKALLGQFCGDSFEIKIGPKVKEYQIKALW